MENKVPDIEIDLHRIELRYAHTRVQNESILNKLRCSIEQYGQLTPVLLVPDKTGRFVLIDGYLRVFSIKRCGRDTVIARICEIDEKQALFSVLRKGNERNWEAIEQASIIRELMQRFDMSMSQVAQKMARDKSWVKRRLDLILQLPEESLCAVKSGHVSPWSASRVLAPMARANAKHASLLTKHLTGRPMPTRELAGFYEHYKKSNRKVRQRMIDDPSLFCEAQKSKRRELETNKVKIGPEGAWLKDIRVVFHILSRLFKQIETVFYQGQPELDRNELAHAFNNAKNQFQLMERKISSHDRPTNPGDGKTDE
ncbi:MAG: ParB N-terminal domain-containing protein [bacterium]|nr:ParB N-terminal domain-containing protein [bacterium]